MNGVKIGERCSIGQNVNVWGKVVIGNGVKIQNNFSIYDSVEIEDNIFLWAFNSQIIQKLLKKTVKKKASVLGLIQQLSEV